MLISSPVFANLGRCLQTRDKALTKSVADIIPSSLFLSSQVAFSTHSTISLKGEKRSDKSCFLTVPHRRSPHLLEHSRQSRESSPYRSTLSDTCHFGDPCSLRGPRGPNTQIDLH